MTRRFDLPLLLVLLAQPIGLAADFAVQGRFNTDQLPPGGGEAGDDAAVWVHPTDASKSVIIGVSKASNASVAGLYVYNLDGRLIPGAGVTGARMNNADVRYGFPIAGHDVDLVAATNRTSDSIDFFTIDPDTRALTAAGSIDVGDTSGLADDFDDPYGIALYRSPTTGSFYAFISNNSGDGLIGQFELMDVGGQIGGSLVRSWKSDDGRGTHLTEGLVADDRNGHLFVGEEDTAIYRYGAEPTDGTTPADRVTVDTDTTLGGHLVADVEGLALFQTTSGAGYLLAASQGNSEFAIYDRNTLDHLGSFDLRAVSGASVNGTDGIDVVSTGLGSHFPSGLFVAQHDDEYALASWDEIVTQAAHSGLMLTRDPRFDPRSKSTITLGDMDLDGGVAFDDIPVFVAALKDPGQYERLFGTPVTRHGDTDHDGDFDFNDISGFVSMLTGSGRDSLDDGLIMVPEPSGLGLVGLGFAGLFIGIVLRACCRRTERRPVAITQRPSANRHALGDH